MKDYRVGQILGLEDSPESLPIGTKVNFFPNGIGKFWEKIREKTWRDHVGTTESTNFLFSYKSREILFIPPEYTILDDVSGFEWETQ